MSNKPGPVKIHTYLPKEYTLKPQLSTTTNRHTLHHLLILQCGDIHPNHGPMLDLLTTHPTVHKRRQKTYFIASTIKFQPEYHHLAYTFEPLFQNSHQLHAQIIRSLPHLYHYTQLLTNHTPPSAQIIYALVVTISPSIDTCDTYLQQPPTPN